MRRQLFATAQITTVLLLLSASAQARPIVNWSRQALLDKSDLVVVVTPKSVKDTNERIDLPGIGQLTPDNKVVGVPAIGMETTFDVTAVIKGDKSLKQFVLHHYRLPDDAKPAINGPSLLHFDPSEKQAIYLLYLVREKDGRYAPTSGQTDPAENGFERLGVLKN